MLEDLRRIMAEACGIGSGVVREEGQPFFLELFKELLKLAGDPDYEFLEEAKVGLPLGVLEELPRTPEVFEEQTKWPLDGEVLEEWALQKANYPSAGEHEQHLRDHLEQEVKEGLVEKMDEKTFEEALGENRAVSALAVLVEDEATGKKRVIHDGTHDVGVNHRIKCRDKVRMPGAREKRKLLEEFAGNKEAVLALVGDFEKAHRRFKYRRSEQGFLACKVRAEDDHVYLNRVGTFGISSTPLVG